MKRFNAVVLELHRVAAKAEKAEWRFVDNDARLSATAMGESDTSYTLLFYDIGESMMAELFA